MGVRQRGGRVAIVTGASSGIGRAVAERLARDGARVSLWARRQNLLEEVAGSIEALGGEALICPVDIRDPAAVRAAAAETVRVLGRIDVLVANAGIGGGGDLSRIADGRLLRTVEVNLLGVARSMQAVLPQMLAQGEGRIIVIASVAAELAGFVSADYAMTKAGAVALADAARAELLGSGVHVGAILPGFIDTPLTHGRVAMRMPGPEVVAQAVVRMLQRPRRRLVVPGWYRPLLFLNRAVPGWGERLARRLRVR